MNEHDRPTYAAGFDTSKLATAEKRIKRLQASTQKKTKPLHTQLDKLDMQEAKMLERVRKEAQKRRSVIERKLHAITSAASKQEAAIYRKAR
jgi:hypothetical protein